MVRSILGTRISLIALALSGLVTVGVSSARAGSVEITTSGIFASSGNSTSSGFTGTSPFATLQFAGVTNSIQNLDIFPADQEGTVTLGTFSLTIPSPVTSVTTYGDTFNLSLTELLPSPGGGPALTTLNVKGTVTEVAGTPQIKIQPATLDTVFASADGPIDYSFNTVQFNTAGSGTFNLALTAFVTAPLKTPTLTTPLPKASFAGLGLFGLLVAGKFRKRILA